MHDRDQLLRLRLQSKCSLAEVVRRQVWSAGLRRERSRPRGCRGGKCQQTAAAHRSADRQPDAATPRNATVSALSLGFLNICSVGKKLDNLLDVRRDCSLDVICLAETWHDDDCVAFRRLRAAGYQVIDRPRPRTSAATADTTTNHGGVAVVAVPGVNLSTVSAVSDAPTTFEFVCVRVNISQFSAIIAVVYRPGSAAVTSVFFHELLCVLDAIATFQEPIYVVGDFNIRLERDDDANTRQLVDLIASYGLSVLPTATTHRDGGTIDAVVVRDDMFDVQQRHSVPGGLSVSVVDVGLSDHHLLTWSVAARRPQPPTETVFRSFMAFIKH